MHWEASTTTEPRPPRVRSLEGEVRCPRHHACFSLKSGVALIEPAITNSATWEAGIVDDNVFMRAQDEVSPPSVESTRPALSRTVIVGGGATGIATAERMRELSDEGRFSILTADDALPSGRSNLSRDFLAGTAPEEWLPLQHRSFYRNRRIDLRLECPMVSTGVDERRVATVSGEVFPCALLIATGTEPRRLQIPGFNPSSAFPLRPLADVPAIIAAFGENTSVAFTGTELAGMEAAAATRAHGLRVHMLAPEMLAMERILDEGVGRFLPSMHGAHGVELHLRTRLASFDGQELTLGNGRTLGVGATVVGVGVGAAPGSLLPESEGSTIEDGILHPVQLQASIDEIHAAGDVACYPHVSDQIRVNHSMHAQRQGQTAAVNMFGADLTLNDEPFSWLHHYGLELPCTGVFDGFGEVAIDGYVEARDFTAKYHRDGRLIAALTGGCDLGSPRVSAGLHARVVQVAAQC